MKIWVPKFLEFYDLKKATFIFSNLLLFQKSTIFRPPKVHLYDIQSITYKIYSDKSRQDLQFGTHMSYHQGVNVSPGGSQVTHTEDRVIKFR
jgi:hypothetical protein